MTPDFWRGRRVFLTGHTGFKGSWLSLWLTKLGAEVSGYALSPPTDPSLFDHAQVEKRLTRHAIGDVRDIAALRDAMRNANPEIAIHMAAQPLVRRSYFEPVETYAVNVMGTVNFLETARSIESLRAILVVTTDKCYENNGGMRGYIESDMLGGHDPYSSSKAAAELVAAAYRQSFFGSTKGAAKMGTARAGNVIGGGDWAADRLIVDMMKAFMKGDKPLIRAPAAVRPWQHVLEPLSGYLTLCEALFKRSPGADSAFNFGPAQGDAKPVSWIANRLSELWGQGAGWVQDTSAGHPHEAAYLHLDTHKAATELGIAPRWNLDDALVSIVHWYRSFAGGESAATLCLSQITAFETDGQRTRLTGIRP